MNNSKKVIFHIDGDSFFVSCEMAIRPELKNKKILISYGKSYSIVVAASYSLKEKGIYVPMKIADAKKIDQDFINLKPNFSLYETISKRIFDYLKKNVSKKIEIGSIDEWYLDVSHLSKFYKSPIFLAKKIQNEILKNIGVSVSIGISYNKWLAKMATELKKPKGISIIRKKDIKNKIWPLPIDSYIGIGKSTCFKLKKININTIKDFAQLKDDDPRVISIFKNKLKSYINNANGSNYSKIDLSKNNSVSIGFQKSFDHRKINMIDEINKSFFEIASNIEKELVIRNSCANKITIIYKTDKHSLKTSSFLTPAPIYLQDDIYDFSIKLFYKIWNEEELKTIGVSVSSLKNKFIISKNISLFEEPKQEKKIISIINETNQKLRINNLKLLSNKEG